LKKIDPDLQIIVFAFQYPFRKDVYDWNGIPVYAFNGRNRGRLSRLITWNAAWKKLRILVKEKNIIGLLSFWCGECALVGAKFARRYNVKHLTWIMGQDAKADNKYVKLIKPKGNELIAMSDFLREEFERNFGVKPYRVITNFVGAWVLQHRPRREIEILGAGSLIPLKQFDLFIKIVAQLDANAVICGEGPERHFLEELVYQNDLRGKVILRGEVDHSQLLQLMADTKVFLHTSNYEGFSGVCLEAIAAGAHVVSFCKPMNEEIKHWHIVKDAEEMREKVRSLLHDPQLDHTPVIYFTAERAAEQMLSSFEAIALKESSFSK